MEGGGRPWERPPDGTQGARVNAEDRAAARTSISASNGSAAAHRIDRVEQHYYAAPAASPVAFPARVGAVPPLASAFQPRKGLREQIDRAGERHATVVLTQVLSGGGGVGKSQLAAAYAHEAADVDVLVWVDAAETSQIVATYAKAARRVGAPGAGGEDAEAGARAFLDWLSTTGRTWLVVLDDLTDFEAARPWWPRPAGPGGRVLATTRRRDAQVSGSGRAVVDVGTYGAGEAADYLRERLTAVDAAHLLDDRAEQLADVMGQLPLALSHAAAYLINEDVTCAQYLALFTDRASRLAALLPPDADTEGYGRRVTTSLLLALEVADRHEPAGLATPALLLAAHLDPAGHPHELWSTPAVTTHLSQLLPGEGEVASHQITSVLRVLHRYALLTSDSRGGHRAVRLHALTARAARESATGADLARSALTAANALTEVWPEQDHTVPELATVLRANADTLAEHAGDLLHLVGPHPVLFAIGTSLNNAGLYDAAVAHWTRLVYAAGRQHGGQNPNTLAALENLAGSFLDAGRTHEAVDLLEQVLADRERLLGPQHPDTLTVRSNLADSYRQAGRLGEALDLQERVLADRERLLGPEHPHTLNSRNNLADSYREAGRLGEAVELQERTLADCERLLGPEHPGTLTVRNNLAAFYQQAGRLDEALDLQERTLATCERLLGPRHPDTLTIRSVLATIHRQAGRPDRALLLLEQVIADREQVLGPRHPDTLAARHDLATAHWAAGRPDEAIGLLEQALVGFEQLFGPQHPSTRNTRQNLATARRAAGLGEDVSRPPD